MISSLFVFATATAQQDVKLVNPETFCKVEVFSAQKGKAASGNFKKCDALKDKTEAQVKSMAECKERALKKGLDCLKTSAAEELGVTAKFLEKFAVSFNSTSFTCAVSKRSGNACP